MRRHNIFRREVFIKSADAFSEGRRTFDVAVGHAFRAEFIKKSFFVCSGKLKELVH